MIKKKKTLNILKTLNVEGMHQNIIKATFDKPNTNSILNDEKLKAFLLRCSLSPLLFSIVLAVLASVIRQEKQIKGV